MRKALLGVAVALAALGLVSTASGAGAQRVSFQVYDDFHAPFTSELCGVEIWIRFEGTVSLTVLTDTSDTVVREIDTQPGFKTTFYSPETGKSFSFPEAIVWHFEYPDGAYAGAPATVMATGMHGRGGKVADAGVVFFEGEVVDVIEIDGVPVALVDFWWTGERGHFNDEDTYLAGRCKALGGTYNP